MLHIVATQVKHGRGGISTALVGFTESPQLQAHGFNIIESHGSGGRWQAFRRAVRQIRADVKPGDTVWLHCGPWLSMLRKWYLAGVAKRQGATVLFHFHSMWTARYAQSWWGRSLLRLLLKRANGIVVLTPWWQQFFTQQFPDMVTKLPIIVTPNPLEPAYVEAASQPTNEPPTGQTYILSMTRLVPGKGVDDVIRAMPLLPKRFTLKIAGDGEQLNELKQLVKRLGLESRVEFVGWIDYEKKQELMRNCHLFCLPSQFDSFGMGFIEAMAFGLPVVALNQGPTPDVVGNSGILVDTPQAETLAEALLQAESDWQTRAENAKGEALKRFAPEPIVTSFLSALASIRRQ